MAGSTTWYKVEGIEQLLVERLDAMTLIYHRRSGITHLVSEPVPEIFAAMGGDELDATSLTERLSARFDLVEDAETSIAARLEELAEIGLVERVAASA